MKKTNTMLITIICLSALVTYNVMANEDGIVYDKNKRLLTIHADSRSYMAILSDVESMTGIKITFRGGIPDKYVTLNMERLPVNRIDDLLDYLRLNNTALIQDQNGNVSEVIILPEGTRSMQMHRRR